MTDLSNTSDPKTQAEVLSFLLLERGDLRLEVAEFLLTDGLEEEASHEVAEVVCIAAFGERLECPECQALVFPGFVCWSCDEWQAPARSNRKPWVEGPMGSVPTLVRVDAGQED